MPNTPEFDSQIDNIKAEIDSYTNYCKLLDYQYAKAKEYADKAASSVKNAANLKIASFPYGVGPAIVAAKATAKQVQKAIQDVQDGIETTEHCIQKLAELYPPVKPCNPRPPEI